MDWTAMIGHHRPVDQDAVCVSTVVRQLGDQAADDRWFIDTERRLQQLEHLVRHPVDLAYLVMHQVRRDPELGARRSDLSRQVREVLGAQGRQKRRRPVHRPFAPGSWKRGDDALAHLACRDLLRIEPLPPKDLRYLLTVRGEQWLEESVYAGTRDRHPYLRRCRLLRSALPDRLLGSRGAAPLDDDLRETGRHLESVRQEEQIRLEEDLLDRVFQATFLESL